MLSDVHALLHTKEGSPQPGVVKLSEKFGGALVGYLPQKRDALCHAVLPWSKAAIQMRCECRIIFKVLNAN